MFNVIELYPEPMTTEGGNAFENMIPLDKNPYPRLSQKYFEWRAEWFAAQEEFLALDA